VKNPKFLNDCRYCYERLFTDLSFKENSMSTLGIRRVDASIIFLDFLNQLQIGIDSYSKYWPKIKTNKVKNLIFLLAE
jgi:hypothetical protein